MGNGFYGCQTAASLNTLTSEPYGQYRNCLFLRVCQKLHTISKTFLKGKATFKGLIHLDYASFLLFPKLMQILSLSFFARSYSSVILLVTSQASRSANTDLNALHPHTTEKKKKKNLSEEAILTLAACSLTPYLFALR